MLASSASVDERDLIHLAVNGEKTAFAVYNQAALLATASDVRQVLETFARDELGHLFALLRRFSVQYPSILTEIDISTPAAAPEAVHPFATAASVDEVLNLALASERESLGRYAQLASAVCGGRARRVLSVILRHERLHIKAIQRLLAAKTEPHLMALRGGAH